MLPVHTRFIKHPSAFVCERREEAPTPMFRHWFSVRGDLVRASLSFAALGVGKLFLNGMPVSPAVLATPFGDYRKTVWYDTVDVTFLLRAGQNLAAAMLGNGFYNESIKTSWDFDTADWRDSPKLMFSLELIYPDRTEYVTSSADWLTGASDTTRTTTPTGLLRNMTTTGGFTPLSPTHRPEFCARIPLRRSSRTQSTAPPR